jgi:hypothetical protein
MAKLSVILFILFEAIIGTIGVAHALLLTGSTPWQNTSYFYIVLWVTSFSILIAELVVLGSENQFGYMGSLGRGNWLYPVAGTAVIICLASIATYILTAGVAQSAIYVPQPHLGLAVAGVDLNSVLNDIFYQGFLVANSEETLCLALSNGLYALFAAKKLGAGAPILAVGLTRTGWGILHAYTAYTGPYTFWLVLIAIASGCIISFMAYNSRVQSFIAAWLQHFGYNTWDVIFPLLRSLIP